MTEVKEVTIICKNEEKTTRFKHLIYERFEMELDDPVLSPIIKENIKEFGDPDCSVKLKATMVI